LRSAFRAVSGEHVVIGRKPEAKVWATEEFASGSLKLVPLPTNGKAPTHWLFHRDGKAPTLGAGSYALGNLFTHDGDEVHGYVRTSAQFPGKDGVTGCGIAKSQQTLSSAVSGCRIVHDQSEANAVIEGKAWQVKLGRDEHEFAAIDSLVRYHPMTLQTTTVRSNAAIDGGPRGCHARGRSKGAAC
jgi:hypothetical protein